MPGRARASGREQLANGPKPGEHIIAAAETADISERTVVIAADALGVWRAAWAVWLPS